MHFSREWSASYTTLAMAPWGCARHSQFGHTHLFVYRNTLINADSGNRAERYWRSQPGLASLQSSHSPFTPNFKPQEKESGREGEVRTDRSGVWSLAWGVNLAQSGASWEQSLREELSLLGWPVGHDWGSCTDCWLAVKEWMWYTLEFYNLKKKYWNKAKTLRLPKRTGLLTA